MTTPNGEVTGARRLERWKLSLLDLTLRNRLLDAREGRTVVPLAGAEPAAAAALLDDDRAIDIAPYVAPDPAAIGGPERMAEAMQRAGADALGARRFLADVEAAELDRRLVAMARAARESLSDGGSRTLWLVLGVLRWYEDAAADVARHAPLVMVPVELRRAGARDRYTVVPVEEDWRWNDTLVEKLRTEHAIELPPPVRGEDGAIDVAATLAAVDAAIASQPTWDVLPACRLAILSFTKFVMWTDLAERGGALLTAPVVAHLAAGEGTAFAEAAGTPAFRDPAALDETVPPSALFAPLDCDASQLAAVLAAADGRSFVLQGPPGTGKSQTITNLIAQCLVAGKSVLFVAEKMAALEVVQRRLTAAGLGDFCLELHSHKARKREVVTELARVLERVWRPNAPVAGDDARLEAARADLDRYVDALHASGPAGVSVHDALGRLGELRDAWRLEGEVGVSGVTADVVAVRREALARLAHAAAEVGAVTEHPWRGATLETWPVDGQERVAAAVGAAQRAGTALAESLQALPAVMPGIEARTRAELEALGVLAEKVVATPRPGAELIMSAGPAAVAAGTSGKGGAAAGAGKAAGGAGGSGAGKAAGAVADKIALVRAKASGGGVASTMDAAPRDPDTWLALVRQRRALAGKIAERWNERVYELDLAELAERFRAWAGRFFLFRWFALRKSRAAVRAALAAGSLPDDASIAEALDDALVVVKTDMLLDAARTSAQSWLGALAPAAEDGADLAPIERAMTWAGELAAAFENVTITGERGAAWRALVATVSDGGGGEADVRKPDDGAPPLTGVEAFAAVARAVEAWREAMRGLAEHCGVTVGDGDPAEGGHLAELELRTKAWAAEPGALRDWTAYARARKAASAAGLDGVIAQLEDETVADEHVVVAWERALHAEIARAGVAAAAPLATFHGAAHHARVAEFAELDRGQLGVARARAIARLSERVPRVTGDVADGGEIGVLLHEAKKQRRHRPLRALFREIPNLLTRLKPCLLMSPLSVAQYLDAGDGAAASFDLVVFDEASQIPTADAIGALARGKAAVVVGDSRQLPPTRFFETGAGVAAETSIPDDDDVEELESILDECVAARLPELRLTWHYRSRHEDLIGFSNDRYYDGRLDVFPAASAQVADLGVSWRKVDGAYDRAGTRTNRAEAEAVVAEILARLADVERAKKSIAVVTFGKPQQELVLDLLDEARRARPELERFFADDHPEPVLVKNLESIQGDERDVVLFSVTYGPDRDGRVTMGFGPLNKAGGERRLNVAVTRAREQLVVFSTLEPEHIADDAAALGVRHLAELLRYARDGVRDGGDRAARPPATPLTRAIGEALTARGWTVHHQIGCAGYRLDLAVVDPDDPGRYVLGIEADGPAYARARTARDRDRLRALVLHNLGWKLHRIWSLDWWHDADKESQRVHNAVIAAIAAARAARSPRKGTTAPVAKPAAPPIVAPPPDPAAGVPIPVDTAPTMPSVSPPPPASRAAPAARATPNAGSAAAGKARTSTRQKTSPGAVAPIPKPSTSGTAPPVTPYQVASVPAGRRKPDDLFDPAREPEIAKVIDAVLAVEAPIHLSLLARRVGAYCGVGRVTAKVSDRVRSLAITRTRAGLDADADVLWRTEQDPAALPTVRVPDAGSETKRDVAELPLSEIAAAALVILHRNIGLPQSDLCRETAKLLGFSRQGDVVKKRMADGIAILAARGACKLDGDRVSLS